MNLKNLVYFSFILFLAFSGQSCENNDVDAANIDELYCSNATFSATPTSGSSFVGTASIPYTGGNGASYEKGTTITSNGVNGLTATLEAGTLTNGDGSISYTISGTPESSGTATFEISFGDEDCTLSLTVDASSAKISSLNTSDTLTTGKEGVSYADAITINYTGGNGGSYDSLNVASTGVEGLVATIPAGKLASGAGTLACTVSGTPTSSGTAVFELSFGGQTLAFSFSVSAQSVSIATDTVKINYTGTSASFSNYYKDDGVSVSVSGGDVTVTSTNTTKEVVYVLSGTSTNGSFKIYSDYKFNLTLNSVSITNSDGPAINIQSGKNASVYVLGTNTLVDGATYASSTEDQKGALFSEGQLNFGGSGTVNITANNKHGIVSDDYIKVNGPSIKVGSAVKDAIHANDYFVLESGTVNLTATSNGIEVEEGYATINGGTLTINTVEDGLVTSYEDVDDTSILPDIAVYGGTINISTTGEKANAFKSEGKTTISTSGTVTLTVSGKGSKAIKSGGNFSLTSGTVKATTSGAAFYDTDDADVAAPAGINCDGNLTISGGTLTVTSTGAGAKGITVDGTAAISGGTTTISATGADFTYNSSNTSEAKGFKSDGAFSMTNGTLNIAAKDDGLKSETSVTISNGTLNVSQSSEGIEAPKVTISGGTINITSTDDGINTTYGTVSGGTESNDGSQLTISGGVVVVTASKDAIDSNGNFLINGGTLVLYGSEEGLDINGNFLVNGGTLISGGPSSNMAHAMTSSSTQVSMFIKSSSALSSSSMLHVEDANGNTIINYKPKGNAGVFYVSSPSLAKGASYKVYFGGTYSGGSFLGGSSGWGAYTGGTYSSSGATLKSSPTTSSSSTVNSLLF